MKLVGAAALALALLFVVPLAPATASARGPSFDARTGMAPLPFVVNNISYVSTVDGFHLSYLEQLPAGYSNSTGAPLVVWLHGVGSSTANVSGGVSGGLESTAFLANASTFGFISLGLNTRSAGGYMLNTPCGGPQATDVVDAIASEKRREKVTALYLDGFSGGSAAALSLVANHVVTNVSGIATSGTITDLFETFAFGGFTGNRYSAFVNDTCGHGVGTSAVNATANGLAYYDSAFRFYPQNLSSVKLYLTGGGADVSAPSNYSKWPTWSNLNSTTRSPTCSVVASVGEPANCSVALVNSTRTQPWLALYELKGAHADAEINYASLFNFWLGHRAGGFATAGFPAGGSTVVAQTFSWEHFPTAFAQTFGCGTGGSAPTGPVNTPVGSAIFFIVEMRQTAGQTVSSVTDTAGDTFAKSIVVTSPVNSRIEVWVVNSSAGNPANHVTGTWSASDGTCDWDVVVTGQRGSAAYSAHGAGTKGTNTTAGDVVSTASPKNLVLMAAIAGNASETWTSVAGSGIVGKGNLTTLAAGVGVEANKTTPTVFYPQVTLGTSTTWTALTISIQPPSGPSPATNLTVLATSLTTVQVGWKFPANASGLVNVTLYYGASCGAWTHATSLFGVVNQTTVVGLAPSTTYVLAVQLWNATAAGPLSACVSASTTGPPVITGLSGVDVSTVMIYLLLTAGALLLMVAVARWKD